MYREHAGSGKGDVHVQQAAGTRHQQKISMSIMGGKFTPHSSSGSSALTAHQLALFGAA
jgi:hypothetical protein